MQQLVTVVYNPDSKLVAPGSGGSMWLQQLPLMPAGGGGWSDLEEDCWVHFDTRVRVGQLEGWKTLVVE